MKLYILYNPLSNRGNSKKTLKQIKKKIKGYEYITKSLLEVKSVDTFLDSLNKEDRVLIIGGDGTLHHLANALDFNNIDRNIEFYSAGTGNDFAKSVKGKNKIIVLNNYLKNLPEVTYNNTTERFINGAGIGLDGFVCHLVNNSTGKKNKFNYFRKAFRGFVKYKPHDLEITINNDTSNKLIVKKAYFVSVMQSSYFGGGMKIAPKASRGDNTLQLVVISKVPKWLLVLIFPTIYLGWHKIFKRYVQFYEVDSVEITSEILTYSEIDGEDKADVTSLICRSVKDLNY